MQSVARTLAAPVLYIKVILFRARYILTCIPHLTIFQENEAIKILIYKRLGATKGLQYQTYLMYWTVILPLCIYHLSARTDSAALTTSLVEYASKCDVSYLQELAYSRDDAIYKRVHILNTTF